MILLLALLNDPHLSAISPTGVRRGTEVELTLRGVRLDDPQELILYRPGIEVLSLEAGRATIRVAADAPVGEHPIRVRTSGGITEVRTIYVGALPIVREKEPNSEFESPQRIDLNVTVEGVVANEDVDHFLIEAKKGQRLTVEVEGIRLGLTMFDPYVAVLDLKRFEVAACDDTALLRQDPFISILVPEDGAYVILLRESAFGGNNNCRYRMHVGDFPRPTAVFPLGGRCGSELEVTFLGDPAGPFKTTVKLPDERLPLPWPIEAEGAPSPNWLRSMDLDNVLETEPNNNRQQATPGALPIAFNGVIDGDPDWFSFAATKGQNLEIRAIARWQRSPLDPVLNLFAPDGKHLQGNDDDAGRLDSVVRFQIPEDGTYFFRVRDHLGRGGADFVYRVEVAEAQPFMFLTIPPVARDDSQSRQWAAVPRGNRWMILLRATRMNFGGDLQFLCENLPEGVTMHAPTMPAGVDQIPVVFEAAADAPIAGGLADLRARWEGHEGRFYQIVDLVLGNPNNTAYYQMFLDRFPVAVTNPAPFRVSIEPPEGPLVRFGTMRLRVTAERDEGFDGPILLELPFRPPGVGAGAQAVMPRGANEVHYTINADGNAALGSWPIAMTASAVVGGGRVYVATPLATLDVAEAVAHGEIPMVVAMRGQTVQVVCKLSVVTPFEGEAELRLDGLPADCSTKAVTVTKASTEAVFEVVVGEKAPFGQHKNLFCQIRAGTALQSLAGGGVLRIDKPKRDEPAPKPVEKPKSRLEELREEAERRRNADP